jgi:2,3-bisphosphoglycerate-independent phosphoglycerate mutase
MIDSSYRAELVRKTDSKIVMLVVDGLGGSPSQLYHRTELESARVPNLDRLAQGSAAGLTIPVALGITPGSGPGHLALFGYDPLQHLIGRGVMEATGIGMELKAGDIAGRGNFATVDEHSSLADRRAGRISSEFAKPLADKLNRISVDSVQVTVTHVKDYRFVLRLRGDGLSDALTETDPQQVGVPVPTVKAKAKPAEKTAKLVNAFVEKAVKALKKDSPANMVLLRGWSARPQLLSMGAAFALNPAAIASYPMYRGIARLAGMTVLETGASFTDAIETLQKHYDEHDFFYLHYKPTDTAGAEGDFTAKKRALEALDEYLPTLLDLRPDVLIVAGDHSTPSALAGHSWHPVPFLLHSQYTAGDGVDRFNERDLRGGSLGVFEAKHVMTLALAHAGKLLKFGA